jgi:hypothetical protein
VREGSTFPPISVPRITPQQKFHGKDVPTVRLKNASEDCSGEAAMVRCSVHQPGNETKRLVRSPSIAA